MDFIFNKVLQLILGVRLQVNLDVLKKILCIKCSMESFIVISSHNRVCEITVALSFRSEKKANLANIFYNHFRLVVKYEYIKILLNYPPVYLKHISPKQFHMTKYSNLLPITITTMTLDNTKNCRRTAHMYNK